MTSIAIYIEGGGDRANGSAMLRQGFEALLEPQKNAARERRMRWKLVLCGGRAATFDAFQYATRAARGEIVGLLVDAEQEVASAAPDGRMAHLNARDGWNLEGIASERVHLMTQCMESWIVADVEALAGFYGPRFHAGALSRRNVLDDEPKASVYAALEAATKATQKGSYGKIRHASEILKRLRPAVIATRCRSFRDFTGWLDAAITGAGVQ
ncbi:MAG TPA: DUF4276 family protein [Kofleriaceae bacterium]|nr:DUF4276 family protein [Kofleriaceae bacterium]